jgi:hypothetical protein
VQHNPRGDIGVNAVEGAVLGLGWIYRRQNEADVGIDGHIEIIGDDGIPLGRLIGVQVKSGRTYFREANDERIVFRTDHEHADYWVSHCLPVIVALHDPTDGAIYWQAINDKIIVSTGVGFRIDVPRTQLIDGASAAALFALTEGSERDQKLARLAADKSLMQTVAREGTVLVLVDEWVNKSSGRGDFTIVSANVDRKTALAEFMIFAGSEHYEEILVKLFPWGNVTVDEAHYDIFEDANEVLSEIRKYGEPEELDAYYAANPLRPIRPYTNVMGEVDRYRLVLELNDVGHAFLTVDKYLG